MFFLDFGFEKLNNPCEECRYNADVLTACLCFHPKNPNSFHRGAGTRSEDGFCGREGKYFEKVTEENPKYESAVRMEKLGQALK